MDWGWCSYSLKPIKIILIKKGNVWLHYLLNNTKSKLSKINFLILHISREENSCVDYLPKLGVGLSLLNIFCKNELPFYINGMIKVDKCWLLYVRKA